MSPKQCCTAWRRNNFEVDRTEFDRDTASPKFCFAQYHEQTVQKDIHRFRRYFSSRKFILPKHKKQNGNLADNSQPFHAVGCVTSGGNAKIPKTLHLFAMHIRVRIYRLARLLKSLPSKRGTWICNATTGNDFQEKEPSIVDFVPGIPQRIE